MAKPRPIPGLACETPFREAAARTVQVRTRELLGHAEGVLDISDIERVHDMRVAARRLRAALELYEPCFPKRAFREALADVKSLADALGLRRDPDVQIAALEELERRMPAGDRPGIESYADVLRERQACGNEELAAALERAEASALGERLLALAAEAARR